jgi:hypothetical protein
LFLQFRKIYSGIGSCASIDLDGRSAIILTKYWNILLLLIKLFIGFREPEKGEERFIERPATWLQYSQPPNIYYDNDGLRDTDRLFQD